MSEPSRRRRIVQWYLDHLQDITTEAGFRTDAGQALYVGMLPNLGADKGDPEIAIAVLIGDDALRRHGDKFFITLPIEIHALRIGNRATAWLDVEDILADIKAAVEGDPTLDGLVRGDIERGSTSTPEREQGALQVGSKVVYEVPYEEHWGHPEA
jgi:hypothetical protein